MGDDEDKLLALKRLYDDWDEFDDDVVGGVVIRLGAVASIVEVRPFEASMSGFGDADVDGAAEDDDEGDEETLAS